MRPPCPPFISVSDLSARRARRCCYFSLPSPLLAAGGKFLLSLGEGRVTEGIKCKQSLFLGGGLQRYLCGGGRRAFGGWRPRRVSHILPETSLLLEASLSTRPLRPLTSVPIHPSKPPNVATRTLLLEKCNPARWKQSSLYYSAAVRGIDR